MTKAGFTRGLFHKDQIGIGVRCASLVAVRLSAGKVTASATMPFAGSAPTEDDFGQLFAKLPGSKRNKSGIPSVHLALGLRFSQVRFIRGMPILRDARAMKAMVQENVSSLFLRSSSSLTVGERCIPQEDGLWLSVYDEHVLETAVRSARSAGIHALTAVPASIATIPPGSQDISVTWQDGAAVSISTTRAGRLVFLERRPVNGPNGETTESEWADAHGAIVHRSNPMRFATPDLKWARLRRVRRIAAGAGCIIALAAIFVLPALRELMEARRMEKELAMQTGLLQDANNAASTLAHRGILVTTMNTFVRRRVRPVEILSALSSALPDSVWISSLRIDSLGVTGTLVGRDVMASIELLRDENEFGSVEIAGPVSREANGPFEFERVSIRLVPRLRPGTSASATIPAPTRRGAE